VALLAAMAAMAVVVGRMEAVEVPEVRVEMEMLAPPLMGQLETEDSPAVQVTVGMVAVAVHLAETAMVTIRRANTVPLAVKAA